MRSILFALVLAVSSVAGSTVAPSPAVAQSIEDIRAEVSAKLSAKISVLEAEIAMLEAVINPSPFQIAQLNAKKAELRSCQLQFGRVGRLPYRALLALNSILPAPVSPT